jgi:hypothetical protein
MMRRGLVPTGPALRWLRHLVEMIAAMLIGMEVLFSQATAIARAFGYPDLMGDLPILATLVMAVTMTVPMALWMDYRGHARRGVMEMTMAMLAPLVVVVPLGVGGVLSGHDLGSMYHLAMYGPMLAVMVYRRSEYMGSHGQHAADRPANVPSVGAVLLPVQSVFDV